jgi:Fe-S cluster assembly protein SufD
MTQLVAEKGLHMSNPARLELSIEDPLPWLNSLRKSAMDRFRTLGFPTSKQEEYRFTNFAPLTKGAMVPATPGIDAAAIRLIEASTFGDEAAIELVFVNGFYAANYSKTGKLPRGLSVVPF